MLLGEANVLRYLECPRTYRLGVDAACCFVFLLNYIVQLPYILARRHR